MNDTQEPTDRTQTQPFKIQSDGLFMDGDAMALFFRSGSKVALADETPIALSTGAIVSPFSDLRRRPAVWARWYIHTKEYRRPPPL